MVWPRRLLSVDAMTFWVFERRSMSGAWALADNIDPVYGEAPRCPGCGNLIGMKPWLPQDRTEWEYGETTGKPIRIVRYAFHKDRMSESSIFKIPETASGEILCYDGARGPEDEIKPYVESHGITRLEFTEIWSS